MAVESPVNPTSVGLQVFNDMGEEEIRADAQQYAGLRRMVKQRGLLDRQPLYYSIKIPLTVAAVAGSIAFLVLVNSLWLQLLNAAFLGMVFTQLGLIGHDAGHQQIFSSRTKNDSISLMVGVLMALVPSWWNDKHNQRHHRNPNRIGEDGDIDVSFFAFTIGRALAKTGFLKTMASHQAFLFFPILMLSSISFLFAGIHYVLSAKEVRYKVIEPILVAIHLSVYFGLLFVFLDPLHAVAFIAVHHAVEGFYMGSVFAPNHKGMPILEEDTPMGFLRQQVITSRDVSAHPITDFVYGGLNYQVEHHLFPSMPRNNLKKVQPIIKEFCLKHGIPFHETSVMQSQREILGYMHKMSAPLRKKQA